MPITTKRGKVVTYYEKHPLVKLSLLWDASTHKVTQPFEDVVTWGHIIDEKHLHYHQTWQSCYIQGGDSLRKVRNPLIMWSCKVPWHLYYHNDYGYQTWHGGSIQGTACLDKITKSLDHLLLQGHVQIKYIISLLPQDLKIKLHKVVCYHKCFPPIKINTPLNM